MKIEKRTLPMYIFLNCITLGIYGFVVAKQMNDEIEAICKGDKQSPRFSYVVAVLFNVFVPVFGQIYYVYWWYQQANRLKMNAGRYGIEIKESGTDVFMMRTILEIPLIFVTLVEFVAALIIPMIIAVLFALIHPVMGVIFYWIFGIILVIFRNELTVGANISNYYMMKNLNRFADVYRNGAEPFDPMAYEYYPVAANNPVGVAADVIVTPPVELPQPQPAKLIGVKGSCAGYEFELSSGEEIIIGKDAKMSSVVIDPAYKEVSRKHVSICYDKLRDQYRVIDFSSNGTWANEEKLVAGQPTYLYRGSILKLANDKNIFRLG